MTAQTQATLLRDDYCLFAHQDATTCGRVTVVKDDSVTVTTCEGELTINRIVIMLAVTAAAIADFKQALIEAIEEADLTLPGFDVRVLCCHLVTNTWPLVEPLVPTTALGQQAQQLWEQLVGAESWLLCEQLLFRPPPGAG